MSAAAGQRELALEAAQHGRFDVVVVGGGILGLSTAWQAAMAGLRVALVEKGDFAGATSSASTKLVHGGLRYLAMGGVRLVRENHLERRALATRVAPHLVRPLPFLVPLYDGGPHGPVKVGAGVVFYSALSRFADGPGRLVSAERAKQSVPALRTEGLRACARYVDHQMNDSRMAMAVARAAAEAGAVLLNHTRVVALRELRGRIAGVEVRDELDGSERGIDARVVVNAAGPWVDEVRRMEDPGAAPSVRLSKGAHLVVRAVAPWRAALTVPIDGVRVAFAIPWEDHLLLGTTDEPYEGDPAEVRCEGADVDQILEEASRALPAEQLRPEKIVYRFAGLRVLPHGDGDTKHTQRETVITIGPRGLVSVAGGKWTTFRRIGAKALAAIGEVLGEPQRSSASTFALPGAADPANVSRVLATALPPLDPHAAGHLARHYGTLAHEVVDLGAADPQLLEPIHPAGPDIWAQVRYAAEREWACTPDDVLRRRTTVSVRGLDSPEVRERVARMLERAGSPAAVASTS